MIGDGAFWQSSIFLPSSSNLMQSSSASPAGLVSEAAVLEVLSVPELELVCACTAVPPSTTSPRPRSNAASAVRIRMMASSARDDEGKHEAEERERFGERDAEEHGRADHAGRLRLAGHRRDGVADDQPDADARADGRAAVDDATADRGETRRDVRRGLRRLSKYGKHFDFSLGGQCSGCMD